MKKYLFFIVSITLVLFMLAISINIGNKNYFLDDYKKYFSEKLKKTLKESIFVYQNQLVLKKIIESRESEIKTIKEQALLISLDKIFFKKQKTENSKIKIFKSGTTNLISARGYIQEYNGFLYFITGTGKIYFGNLTYDKDIIIMSSIKSNFIEIVNLDYLLNEKNIVNHFLVDKENLYISFTSKINEQCYNNSIVVGKINNNLINFENFFKSEQCLSNFFNFSSSGRLENFDNENIIFSTGDFDPYSDNDSFSQQKDDLRGKILKINKLNGKYEILSIGHRNPGGLFYDKSNKIIFSSDHGAKNGDEINAQKIENYKVYNFGWPIASYSEHYDLENLKNLNIFKSSTFVYNKHKIEEKYKKQPLLKSHSQKGFVEPIITWKNQSVAPTQVISIYDDLKKEFNLYFGSLGNTEELHKSLHYINFDTNFKILDNQSIKLNERVRDMIFIKEINSLLLYLEESSSLAFVKLDDNYKIK